MHHSHLSPCTWILLLMGGFLVGCSSGESAAPSDDLTVDHAVPDAQGWVRSPTGPVIVPTTVAGVRDSAAADPSVVWDEESNRWRIWFSTSVSGPGTRERVLIRTAESSDGEHWQIQVEPALDAGVTEDAWDYDKVETPSVVRNPDHTGPRWLLFYSGANTGATAEGPAAGSFPWYRIGMATSADGRHFTRVAGLGGRAGLALRPSQVLAGSPGYAEGVVADPEVVVRDGVLHLWCSSFGEDSGHQPVAWGISHLTSRDGIAWTTEHPNPLVSLFRPGTPAGGAQPSVLWDADQQRFELWFTDDDAADKTALKTTWFTATGFWHATSPDGVAWTVDRRGRDLLPAFASPRERYGLLTGVEVVRRGGFDWAFLSAWGTGSIPDPSYVVPLLDGTLAPAVATVGIAKRPVAVTAPRTLPRPAGLAVIGPTSR